jgi:hypothetical protein
MSDKKFPALPSQNSTRTALSTINPFEQGGYAEDPFTHTISAFGKAAEPYIAEGNKHLSEETMIALKGYVAIQLKTKLGYYTIEQLSQATQDIMAIVRKNEGTEWFEYIHAFSINYLNFLQHQLATTSQVTMEHIDRVVQRPIDPPTKSWLRRTFGGS